MLPESWVLLFPSEGGGGGGGGGEGEEEGGEEGEVEVDVLPGRARHSCPWYQLHEVRGHKPLRRLGVSQQDLRCMGETVKVSMAALGGGFNPRTQP